MPGEDVHEAAGDQPQPVAGLARGADLLTGGELPRAHLLGNRLQLRIGQAGEQRGGGQRVRCHWIPASRAWRLRASSRRSGLPEASSGSSGSTLTP